MRVEADYSASPTWTKEGYPHPVTGLPIPLELMDRLERWQEVYESFNTYGPPEEMTQPSEIEPFALEGLAAAIEVKRQLPDWTIIYHDEYRWACRPKAPAGFDWREWIRWHQDWFDYEITPEVVATGQPPDNYPVK